MYRCVVAVLLLFLTACFSPAHGQYLCDPDQSCPDGLFCAGGVCVDQPQGRDGSAVDASMVEDVRLPDSSVDAARQDTQPADHSASDLPRQDSVVDVAAADHAGTDRVMTDVTGLDTHVSDTSVVDISHGDLAPTDTLSVDDASGPCTVPSDCPTVACYSKNCVTFQCSYTPLDVGVVAPASEQHLGDCQLAVCNGGGDVVNQVDNSDVPPADGNLCTWDACATGVPYPRVVPGIAVGPQTPGDCLEMQCDDEGHLVSRPADDPPAAIDCFEPYCQNGGVQHSFLLGELCDAEKGICGLNETCVALPQAFNLDRSSSSSDPHHTYFWHGAAYAVAADPASDGKDQLFRTDGTLAGTYRVSNVFYTDVNLAIEAKPFYGASANHLYAGLQLDFYAGDEIFQTNGSQGDGREVPFVTPTGQVWNAPYPRTFFTLDGQVFGFGQSRQTSVVVEDDLLFWIDESVTQAKMIIADGMGVFADADLQFPYPEQTRVLPGTAGEIAVFPCVTPTLGTELCQFDGLTVAGEADLHSLPEIEAGVTDPEPAEMTSMGGNDFVFVASTAAVGRELFIYRQSGGITVLKDILSGAASSSPRHLVKVGDQVVFMTDGPTYMQLWRSDGSTAGTMKVMDLPITIDDTVIRSSAVLAGTRAAYVLVEKGPGTGTGVESWDDYHTLLVTDGTAAGSVELLPGALGDRVSTLVDVGNQFCFVHALNDVYWSGQLFCSNGTVAGTYKVGNVYTNGILVDVIDVWMVQGDGVLYYPGPYQGGIGNELWRFTP